MQYKFQRLKRKCEKHAKLFDSWEFHMHRHGRKSRGWEGVGCGIGWEILSIQHLPSSTIILQLRDRRKNKTWNYTLEGIILDCHYQFQDRVNNRSTSNILWYSVTHLKAYNIMNEIYSTKVNEFLFRMSNLKTTCHMQDGNTFFWLKWFSKRNDFVDLCLCLFLNLHKFVLMCTRKTNYIAEHKYGTQLFV